MLVAVLTIVFTCIFLVIYKYLVNPQIVVYADSSAMSQCPERWLYNSGTSMCEPAYDTSCMPFDPKAPTLKSVKAKCNVANSCGTTWGTMCP